MENEIHMQSKKSHKKRNLLIIVGIFVIGIFFVLMARGYFGESIQSIQERLFFNGIIAKDQTPITPGQVVISASDDPSYSTMVQSNVYKAYFKNNSNTNSFMRYIINGYQIDYDLSGSQVNWYQTDNQPSATDTLGSGFSSNSQNTLISNQNNVIKYNSAFSIANLTYDFNESYLKENFVMRVPPTIKAYNYLRFGGHIYFNTSLDICANGVCYKPKGTQDDFTTSGRIEFKSNGITQFYMPEPVITDSDGKQINAVYDVHGSNAQMIFNILIPTSYLQTAVYPIYIDPTYTIPVAQTGVLTYNATIESNNCTHLNIDTSQTPMDSLVGYWNADCDSTGTNGVKDMSIYSNKGTLTNGAFLSESCAKYGSAGFCFDGSNDYINTVDAPFDFADTNTTNATFTLSAWINFKANAVNTVTGIFYKRATGASTSYAFHLSSGSTPKLVFYVADGTTTYRVTGNTSLVNNTWYYVTAVRQSDRNLEVYLNGVLDGVNSSANMTESVEPLQLGGSRVAGSSILNGSLDDAMVFNTSLTLAQINYIYNATQARFYPRGEVYYNQINVSTNNTIATIDFPDFQANEGTNVSAYIGYWDLAKGYNESDPSLVADYHADNVTGNGNVVAGKVGNALQFDGVNDYINLGTTTSNPTINLTATNAFTTMAWINWTGGNVIDIVSSDNGASNARRFNLEVKNSTGLQFNMWNSTGTLVCSATTGSVTNIQNTWTHASLTFDSLNGARLYGNGVNIANCSGITSIEDGDTVQFLIGARTTSAAFFNGTIDEVRIWNRSLTATEISNIYNNESTGIPDPNMNRTGLVGEWLMNESATSLWASTTPDSSGNGNHGAEINMIGANITDSSGNNNNGLTHGLINLLNTGQYNQSISVNPITTGFHINIPYNSTTMNLSNSSYSWGTWVYINTTSNQEILNSANSNSALTMRFALWIQTSKFDCLSGNGTTTNAAADSTNIVNGVWYHIFCVQTPTDLTLYVNGVQKGQDTSITTNIVNNNNDWYFGGYTSSSTANTLNGSIDEVQIWNRSLSALEIQQLYSLGRANWSYTAEQNITEKTENTFNYSASPSIVSCWINSQNDTCGSGNNGNLLSNASWNGTNRGIIGNNTLLLNQTNAKMNVGNDTELSLNNSLTLSAWIYPTDISTNSYGTVIAKDNYPTSRNYWFGQQTTSAKVSFRWFNTTGTDSNSITSNDVLVANGWNHIVAVVNNNVLAIYVAGQSVPISRTSIDSMQINNTINVSIGNMQSNAYQFRGYIDEVAIWNRALSASEVQEIYLNTKQGRTNPMNFTIQTSTTNVLPIAVLYSNQTSKWYTPFLRGVANVGGYLTTSFPPDLCAYNGTGNWILDCTVCNGYAMLSTTYDLLGNNFTATNPGSVSMPGTIIKNVWVNSRLNGCILTKTAGAKILHANQSA